MSARMLRRALQQKKAADFPAEQQESESEEEEQRSGGGGVKNIFSLLDNQDGSDDEEQGTAEAEPQPSPSSAPSVKPRPKKRGKKESKKKKAKEEVEEEMVVQERKESSLDEIMQELQISGPETVVKPTWDVLTIDPKYLRAQEELRRIFGSKVINEVQRSERKEVMKKRPPGIRNVPRHFLKTNLVSPMDTWPRWDGGISMEVVGTKDGVTTFRYVYSANYLDVQGRYEALAASHNINGVAHMMAMHPYHVDSLLTMAEVYRHVGELQQAASLLERCLYALECAWHPWFNPMQGGKCRLDYSVSENKPLFRALHRHMQQLGRRGCHRTALEVCKLLLSLDPEDPFGALFSIDYYALRSEQYEWLTTFVDKYSDTPSLPIFPNFSFSLAVARFYLEGSTAKRDPEMVPASDLLQQALMLHPLVFSKIFSKAPIKEDDQWLKILKHSFFAKADAGGPTLEHLIDIYVERNSVVWRASDLQAWLKEVAAATLTAVREGQASDWACARDEAFQAVHNEYQHLTVSEYSDTVSTLPPDILRPEAMGNVEAAAAAEPPGAQPADVADLRNRNPFAVFLETLMPFIHYAVADADGDEEYEDGQSDEESVE